MLYIFGGLPGTGKSTLAKHLAAEANAVWIRIDTIEQQLRNSGFNDIYDEGYQIAFAVAQENLKNHISVVADSTNPVNESRQSWVEVAKNSGVDYLEIEVICSDKEEHRNRIENRSTDIKGLTLPTWQSVSAREYEPWNNVDIVIDTAGKSPEQSQNMLLQEISSKISRCF